MDVVVAIHNNVNERAWQKVMAWESLHRYDRLSVGKRACSCERRTAAIDLVVCTCGLQTSDRSLCDSHQTAPRPYGSDECSSPQLLKFCGRPTDLSPKARFKTWLGYVAFVRMVMTSAAVCLPRFSANALCAFANLGILPYARTRVLTFATNWDVLCMTGGRRRLTGTTGLSTAAAARSATSLTSMPTTPAMACPQQPLSTQGVCAGRAWWCVRLLRRLM